MALPHTAPLLLLLLLFNLCRRYCLLFIVAALLLSPPVSSAPLGSPLSRASAQSASRATLGGDLFAGGQPWQALKMFWLLLYYYYFFFCFGFVFLFSVFCFRPNNLGSRRERLRLRHGKIIAKPQQGLELIESSLVFKGTPNTILLMRRKSR